MGKKAFLLALARGARGKDGAKALVLPDYYIDGSAGAEGVPQTVSGDAPLHFENALRTPLEHLITNIKPVQDLHGYDAPWPDGGGVNKIDVNQLVSFGTTYGLTTSFDGDWIVLSGEYTHTNQSANFRIAVLRDTSVFPVTKFKAFPDSNTSSHMSSAPFGLADGNKTLTIYISGMVQGETYNLRCKIVGYEGDTAPTSWTPYSNICPISGWKTITAWDDAKYGGLVEWNQQVKNGNFASKSEWIEYASTYNVEDNTATVIHQSGEYGFIYQPIQCIIGHKYFVSYEVHGNGGFYIYWDARRIYGSETTPQGEWAYGSVIITGANNGVNLSVRTDDSTIGDSWKLRNIQICDLTQIFGAGNEPSTVEEFRALFPKDYYAYNAGTHTSVGEVNGSGYWKVPVTFGALGKNLLPYSLGYISSDLVDMSALAVPLKAGAYVLSFGSTTATSWRYWVREYDDDGQVITTGTNFHSPTMNWRTGGSNGYLSGANGTNKYIYFTIDNDVNLSFGMRYGDVGDETTFSNCMLENSVTQTTPTSYEPYNDTIYGGTLDLATGDGTIDMASVDLGTLTWVVSSYRFNINTPLPNAKLGNHADCMCEVYKPDVGSATRTVDLAVSIANGGYVYIYDTTFTGDATAFKAAMSGVKLYYEIATPIPFHIDGLSIKPLKGDNNVWTDCGDTLSATYTVNAPVKTLEVTGEPPLSLPYSVGKPLKAWSVDVLPKQDLNGYDAPWPAGGGANKFDKTNFTPINSYYVNISGVYSAGSGNVGMFLQASPNTTYTIWVGNIRNSTDIQLASFEEMPTSAGAVATSYSRAIVPQSYTSITTGANDTCLFIKYNNETQVTQTYTSQQILDNLMLVLGGTPPTAYSPYANICPIHGTDKLTITTAGKNLLDNTELYDYTNWSSTAIGGSSYQSNASNRTYNLPTIAGNTYTISFGISADSFPTYLILGKWAGTGYDAELIARFSSTTLFVQSSYTFSVDDGYIYYLRMGSTGSEASFNAQMANVSYGQLEFGSTATPYTTYLAPSQTVLTLPQTVYTGTIGSEGGESRWGVATLDDSKTFAGTDNQIYCQLGTLVHTLDYSQKIICDKLPVFPRHDSTVFKDADYGITGYADTGNRYPNNNWIYIKIAGCTTTSEVSAWLADNNVTIVYEAVDSTPIAITPPTIPTPTGTATAWAAAEDGTVDDMTVTYKGHVMPGGES